MINQVAQRLQTARGGFAVASPAQESRVTAGIENYRSLRVAQDSAASSDTVASKD
jgi:hypothetical protein